MRVRVAVESERRGWCRMIGRKFAFSPFLIFSYLNGVGLVVTCGGLSSFLRDASFPLICWQFFFVVAVVVVVVVSVIVGVGYLDLFYLLLPAYGQTFSLSPQFVLLPCFPSFFLSSLFVTISSLLLLQLVAQYLGLFLFCCQACAVCSLRLYFTRFHHKSHFRSQYCVPSLISWSWLTCL